MSRHLRPVLALFGNLVLALSAIAQANGLHWQQDIESAKALAKQTGRLVLVHVWADGCGPCQSLERNVFNQPGVAGAIEQRFVPVKLNANEYPAIAQGFGITRVPTDVILTADGQVVTKMISPATPAAYVAETHQAANQAASQMNQPYEMAAAAAPNPAALNPAYANLPIGETSVPLIASSAPSAQATNHSAPSTNMFGPPAATPPATLTNSYVNQPATGASPTPSVTPIPANPAANPYAAYAPPAPAAADHPSIQSPSQTPQIGYDAMSGDAASGYGVPADQSVPPANATGPVSSEANRNEYFPQQHFGATASPSTTVEQQVAAPDVSKLPPGAPPLGFDGYCPVSMRTAWKWVPGNPQYGAIHRGRTYWFAGPQEQQEFLAQPDYYGPALAGIDPVMAIDHKQSVPGLREHSLDYDNQFYLFSSEATLQQFTANPERYASGVRQAMGIQASQQTR